MYISCFLILLVYFFKLVTYLNGTNEQIVAMGVMSMMVKLSAQIHVGRSAE